MAVATTCHESRIAATSHNVEKQGGPARPLSRASKPSLHKYVIRVPVVHEFFPITALPPASGHAALASQESSSTRRAHSRANWTKEIEDAKK
jgi:hypothetical protein